MNEIHANIQLLTDDTSLYLIVEHPDVTAQLLNIDCETIDKSAKLWLVTFNPSKSESLLISQNVNVPIHPPIFKHNQKLTEVISQQPVEFTYIKRLYKARTHRIYEGKGLVEN